jgi:hypothetical protein
MLKFAQLAFVFAALLFAQQPNVSHGDKVKLWAAISVFQPIYWEGKTDALQVEFGLVNDGSSTINPNIESSHLLINGVELKDWSFVIHNGIGTPSDYALPPGQPLIFGAALGRYFQKPGVYTVGWRGETFKASDITLRVLPRQR